MSLWQALGLEASDEEKDAARMARESRNLWLGLEDQIRASGMEQQLTFGEGGDVNPYSYGYMVQPTEVEARYLGPSEYDALSSEFAGLSSAYDNYAPDAAGRDMQMDAAGYYRNLMQGGPDAQAEASYARARSQAEQRRRANSEAALRSAEARGMGGSNETLLAELVNNQGSATDLYQAGLDRAATEQARRDAAAGSYAGVGSNLYGQDASVAATRAGGQDAFAVNRAGGMDAFADRRASGVDAWEKAKHDSRIDVEKWNAEKEYDARTRNTDRLNTVGDTNTALGNETNRWNKIGNPQQVFNNLATAYTGASGATPTAMAGTVGAQPGNVGDFFNVAQPVLNNATKFYTMVQ